MYMAKTKAGKRQEQDQARTSPTSILDWEPISGIMRNHTAAAQDNKPLCLTDLHEQGPGLTSRAVNYLKRTFLRMTSGRSVEEPQEEQPQPAKKLLRAALTSVEEEALTVETNAKSYIKTNNENQLPKSEADCQNVSKDAACKSAGKTPAKSKRAALLPLGDAAVATKQRQQPLGLIFQATAESWTNIHIPPVPCLDIGDAHFTREAAQILNSPPCHESDKGQFFVGSSVEENRCYRPYMEDRSYATVYNGAAFLGLYDGHAGSGAAMFLEQNLLPMVLSSLTPGADINTAMCGAYTECNAALEATGCQHGSTATTVVMIGSRLIAANVGDSPALVVTHSGAVHNLIEEHKIEGEELARVLDMGVQVKQSNGPRYMSSADGTRWLNMSRAFGDWGYPGVLCKPYVCTLDVSDAKYLILGSDGLTERWSLSSVAAHVKDFMLTHATPVQPQSVSHANLPSSAGDESSSPSWSSPQSSSPPSFENDVGFEKGLQAAAAVGQGSSLSACVGAGPGLHDTSRDQAGSYGVQEDTEMLSPGGASTSVLSNDSTDVHASGSCRAEAHPSSIPNPHSSSQTSSSAACHPHSQQQTASQERSSLPHSWQDVLEPCCDGDQNDLKADGTCRDQQRAVRQGSAHQRKQQAEYVQQQSQQEREAERQRLAQEEEAAIEQRSRKIRSDVQQLARELVQQAVLSGSTDNITVVVMDVQEYLRQHSSRFAQLSIPGGQTATGPDHQSKSVEHGDTDSDDSQPHPCGQERFLCGALAHGWAPALREPIQDIQLQQHRQSTCNAHRVQVSPTSSE